MRAPPGIGTGSLRSDDGFCRHRYVLRWLTPRARPRLLLVRQAVRAGRSSPLDLDATRTALTAIDAALKQPRSDRRGPAAFARRERSARRRPAGGDRRLDAAAGSFGQTARRAHAEIQGQPAAPANDAATAELAAEKAKHDALDADLRAARAMLLAGRRQRARISAGGAHCSRARPSRDPRAVLNPQLWVERRARDSRSTSRGHDGAGRRLARERRRAASARLQALGRLRASLLLLALVARSAALGRRGGSSIAIRTPPTPDPAAPGARRAPGRFWCSPLSPLLGLLAVAPSARRFRSLRSAVQGVLDASSTRRAC